MTFAVLGLLFILVISFIAWAAWPWSLKGRIEEVNILQFDDVVIEAPDEPAVIKLLTWNLGHLYGKGSEGKNYEFREKEFFEVKLKTLVDEIKDWGPDVIFFQEIDFDSHRSHYVDQAVYVAKNAGYPFVAEAPSWESNYVPYPYWPLKNHFKRINSGGAILSRYPILSHKIELLPKALSRPWWYNLFYPHRYFQTVVVDFGGDKRLRFINLHLEAFDKIDRASQVRHLVSIVDGTDIVAGDFNMVPDVALKKHKFYNNDDYESDESFSLMGRSNLNEVIPEEIYAKDEQMYFTFPAWQPDRRLDYIFYEKDHKMMKAEVLPSMVSDHLPIRASFQIRSPKVNPFEL